MADLRISDLAPLAGSDLAANDEVPITDTSASETKKISAKELIQSGVGLVDAGSIPVDKIAGGGLGTTTAPAQFLAGPTDTAGQVSARVIVGTDLPAASVTERGGISIGTGLTAPNGVASIKPAGTAEIGGVSIALDSGLSVGADGAVTHTDTVTGTTKNGFTINDTGHVTAIGTIPGTDLPLATDSTIGGISVGSGLTVTAAGQLNHEDSITPGTANGFTYNATGHITAKGQIAPADLPKAGITDPGIASFPTTGGLTVTGAGAASIATTGVAAAQYTKVTVNAKGQVTAGGPLTASDVPVIDANKISGTIETVQLADKSVTRPKLADYSISYIQEADPGVLSPGFIGVLWYQESTAQLRMYNGNSWRPVGFGNLSNQNLRWGGIVNADTGLITGVTESGTTAGLTVGEAVPAASDPLGGLYLLVGVAGSNIGVSSGITYDAGDWCLCVNDTEGWIRIDLAASGGGGGGASTLDDLLDVTLTTPTANQYLQLQASNQWTNVDLDVPVQSVNGETGDVVLSVGDLDDVTIGTLANGNILSWNGTAWINKAAPPADISGSSINQLNDVDASSATNGQVMVWNGTDNWVPGDMAGGDVDSVNNKTGVVVLTAADVNALPDTTSLAFVPLGSWAALTPLT